VHGAPSPLFRSNTEAVVESARLGPVLDLACGRGRHAIAAAELGLPVVAIDRNPEHLATLARFEPVGGGAIETVCADLETPAEPPLRAGRFGSVLVFHYLHRPLMPWIEALLAPGGLLLYETFTRAQRELAWGPSREEFLLAPGELPTLFPNLNIEQYSEGRTNETRPSETGRLRARRPRD
jgi:SAM-dependent methyltransferase